MTTPLTPEAVAQMVADLSYTDGSDGEMSMLYRCEIADAITTLTAENATLREDRSAVTEARDMMGRLWATACDELATLRASEAAAVERVAELEAATQLALDTADMSNNTRAALLGAINSGVALTPTADKE